MEVEVKYKTIKVQDWEKVNANVAIWARDKDDVTDEEYQNFYKVCSLCCRFEKLSLCFVHDCDKYTCWAAPYLLMRSVA